MSKEIERKFLVSDNSFEFEAVEVKEISQGYLCLDPDRTVRVRILNSQGFLTVKTRNEGCVRGEWEYEIPVTDARELLQACLKTIVKKRYIVPASCGLKWEVDVFYGRLKGLVLAEIELPDKDFEFDIPAFIGKEVTGQPEYYNSNL